MRLLPTLLSLGLAACGRSSNALPFDAGVRDDGAIPPQPDANTTLGTTFRFAVVGDTRPANEDDVTAYPTAVITKIWADVQAMSPRPDFAISTGDYMFADPTMTPSTVDMQLDRYLTARAQYSNAVFAAMGNHECTGATDSNCSPGSASGVTQNYAEFMRRFLNPLGIMNPYYAISLQASDGSWTAKVVVIAANAWNVAQSAWLDQALTPVTTYTFIVRHESQSANTAPGVTPSEGIIATHPYTLKIVGHTHSYEHDADVHEVICGNGGAPLTSGQDYGYAIIERLADGTIQLTEYDYETNVMSAQFRLNADGTAAP